MHKLHSATSVECIETSPHQVGRGTKEQTRNGRRPSLAAGTSNCGWQDGGALIVYAAGWARFNSARGDWD